MSRSLERQDLLSGRSLAAALATIAVLAFVVPPGLALWLQRTRVGRATDQLHAAAASLIPDCLSMAREGGALGAIDLLVGPGDPPVNVGDRRWASSRTASIARCLPPGTALPGPDPWLRGLLVNVAAAREGDAVWVLSAGPNGILETPFAVADGPLGDDLGTAVVVPAR